MTSMAWSKKKLVSKLTQYFNEKNIVARADEEDNLKIKLELCFIEQGYMLYPYITIEENLVSININVNQHVLKGFSFEKINEFNEASNFFKAYLTKEGIVVLEYRFYAFELETEVFDSLISSLFLLQKEIDML